MNKTKLFSALIVLLAITLTMSFVLSGCKKDSGKDETKKGTVVISEDEYGVEKDDNVVEDPFADWDEDTSSAKTSASSKTGGADAPGKVSSSKSGGTSQKNKTTTSKKQTAASKTTKPKKNTTTSADKDIPTETDEGLWTGYY